MGHAGENSTDYIATAAAKAARIAELDAEMTPSEIAAATTRSSQLSPPPTSCRRKSATAFSNASRHGSGFAPGA
jgi:hypothetical protein